MVTSSSARSEVSAIFEVTKADLGGSWKVEAQTWTDCAVDSQQVGAQFTFQAQRFDQDLPASPSVVTEKMQALWKQHGVDGSVIIDDNLTPPRHILSFPAFGAGTAPDGLFMRITMSDGTAIFHGTSRCASGDAYKLELGEEIEPPTR